MADVEFIDNTMKVNRAIEDAVGAFYLKHQVKLHQKQLEIHLLIQDS